jgi:hypothetical protein
MVCAAAWNTVQFGTKASRYSLTVKEARPMALEDDLYSIEEDFWLRGNP